MTSIEELRVQIQNIDRAIIKNIADRQDLCRKIASLKRESGMQVIDIEQENRNFVLYGSLSKECAIDPEFISRVFKLIISNSRAIQNI